MAIRVLVTVRVKVTVNSLAINVQTMQNAWVFSIVPVQLINILANNQTFTSVIQLKSTV